MLWLMETIFTLQMLGRGRSVGSNAAWDARGSEIDPRIRHILS